MYLLESAISATDIVSMIPSPNTALMVVLCLSVSSPIMLSFINNKHQVKMKKLSCYTKRSSLFIWNLQKPTICFLIPTMKASTEHWKLQQINVAYCAETKSFPLRQTIYCISQPARFQNLHAKSFISPA